VINESGVFLAQVGFALRAARDLSHFRWLLNSRFLPLQKSLEQHRHPKIAVLSDGLGIPENTRAALPKISIPACRQAGARNNASFILMYYVYRLLKF